MFGENLRKAPLIRVIIPIGAGICMGTLFQNSISRDILLLCLLFISILLLATYKLTKSSEYRWLFGLALISSMILLGLMFENIYRTRTFSRVPQSKSRYFQLKVTEHIKVSEDWNVFYADCIGEKNGIYWKQTNVCVQLYLANGKNIPSISPGEEIIIRSPLIRTSEPANPGAFNYKKFLDHKGIWGTIYLKDSASIIHIEQAKGFSLEKITYQLQDKFLSVFRKFDIGGDELALLSALTIGVRDQIDNEINKAFAASGAMHILSVSGLHVGIVYLVFAQLLSLMGRNRYARILSVILQIAFLWFYAFLTGLSPAVNRAAAMFSFLAIGKSLNRSASSLNIVSGSALILLIVNPFLIFDMGFQLSYLAVISIILFHSFLYNLFDFKSYLADQVWKLTALSLAAQIGTFPLSILYFHQFPNYFILTNLLVVPLAAVILYLAIGMVFLFWIPYFSIGMAWILKISLKGMILSVMQVEHLPFSVISNISITIVQLVLLYIMIILFACFIHLRSRSYFYAFISCFAMLLISLIARDIKSYKNQFFIVFQQKDASIMMAGNRYSALVLYSGKNPKIRTQAINLLKGISLERRIKTIEMNCIDSLEKGKIYSVNKIIQVCRVEEGWVFIGNGKQHIAWLKAGNLDKVPFNASLMPDVFVIAKLMQLKEIKALTHFNGSQVVFDSSCKPSVIKEKSSSFAEKGVLTYDVATKGAYLYGY